MGGQAVNTTVQTPESDVDSKIWPQACATGSTQVVCLDVDRFDCESELACDYLF